MSKTAGGEIYSNETADRLSKDYGIDASDELSKILSEQIAKEIDKEILSSLGLEKRKYHRKKSINKIFNI
jgi:hypothetical protein